MSTRRPHSPAVGRRAGPQPRIDVGVGVGIGDGIGGGIGGGIGVGAGRGRRGSPRPLARWVGFTCSRVGQEVDCNPMCSRLQPHVLEAATLCAAGCNPCARGCNRTCSAARPHRHRTRQNCRTGGPPPVRSRTTIRTVQDQGRAGGRGPAAPCTAKASATAWALAWI